MFCPRNAEQACASLNYMDMDYMENKLYLEWITVLAEEEKDC